MDFEVFNALIRIERYQKFKNLITQALDVFVVNVFDYCIGHYYFMGIHDLADLKSRFANRIIPLLREYFYGNPAKIGMVLGKTFITPKTVTKGEGHRTTDNYVGGVSTLEKVYGGVPPH